ncbi:hypothetical protein [Paenibacillus chitinolyticus]|uniref:hypothetical protein n=1 Tax=Paenibacillus chitinolyticus TaxID=79263 RepID=UPI00295ECD11|nr:hypothetical protein [Paenibacillus chitinolyticus]
MGTIENLEYENFIRRAFAIVTGQFVERYGDPAQLANTDVFSAGPLYQVKAAISYSMCMLRAHIINEYNDHPSLRDETAYDRLDSIIEEVLNAPNKESVFVLIQEFKDRYFTILRGE